MSDLTSRSADKGIGTPKDVMAANATDYNSVIALLKGILNGVNAITSLTIEETILDITGEIAALTTLTTNASGANFTKSGDSINLGASSSAFNSNNELWIFLDGVLQDKGTEAVYVTANSFTLSTALSNGDKITILKQP